MDHHPEQVQYKTSSQPEPTQHTAKVQLRQGAVLLERLTKGLAPFITDLVL